MINDFAQGCYTSAHWECLASTSAPESFPPCFKSWGGSLAWCGWSREVPSTCDAEMAVQAQPPKKHLSVHTIGSCCRACFWARGGEDFPKPLQLLWSSEVDVKSLLWWRASLWQKHFKGLFSEGLKPALWCGNTCLSMDRGEGHTFQLVKWNNWLTTWAPAPCVKRRWCQITSQVTGSLMQVSQRFWSMQWRMVQCKALLFIPPLSPRGEKCRVHHDIYWNVMGKKSQKPSSEVTLSCRQDPNPPVFCALSQQREPAFINKSQSRR